MQQTNLTSRHLQRLWNFWTLTRSGWEHKISQSHSASGAEASRALTKAIVEKAVVESNDSSQERTELVAQIASLHKDIKQLTARLQAWIPHPLLQTTLSQMTNRRSPLSLMYHCTHRILALITDDKISLCNTHHKDPFVGKWFQIRYCWRRLRPRFLASDMDKSSEKMLSPSNVIVYAVRIPGPQVRDSRLIQFREPDHDPPLSLYENLDVIRAPGLLIPT